MKTSIQNNEDMSKMYYFTESFIHASIMIHTYDTIVQLGHSQTVIIIIIHVPL